MIRRATYLLRLWFGLNEPVDRLSYALTGIVLVLVKYGVEAVLVWHYASAVYWPWQFVNPVLSMRVEMLHAAPPWVGWFLFVWSVPFLWIAMTMSVRRAADSGVSPWLGMLVLVPLINLFLMLGMCLTPSDRGPTWSPQTPPPHRDVRTNSAPMAAVLGLMVGAVMLVVSVFLLKSYGASLFMGAPLLMSTAAAYFHSREVVRSYNSCILLGLATVLVGSAALLLLAVEGIICLVMALPIMLPLGALGGALGKAVADSTRRPLREMAGAILVLPLLMVAEARFSPTTECDVTTSVVIDAPRQVVWRHVIDFPDLPPPTEWYFRAGIACPQRAKIFGRGVGATRHCEFTTGTFVEPITVWEPGRRLAFDVTEQPAPMFELSPYRHVHPPHLDGYLRSKRGEFLLTELPGGRTRLQGRTWYEFEMFPQSYWTLWSHLIIHRIHERVLQHVCQLAEDEA